jgi:hypothetical protein
VFCIREKLSHPQLLATNRHISCGGLEVKDLKWQGNALHGLSELVPNDHYVIYLYEGLGYAVDKIAVKGARMVGNEQDGRTRKITLLSAGGGLAEWTVQYLKK